MAPNARPTFSQSSQGDPDAGTGRAQTRLGLVIDLDICVGCQACAIACKAWNSCGSFSPLNDYDPHGGQPTGVWLNRVHSFDVATDTGSRTVHFPRSCLHCEEPECVTVCPTGASYKREEDGIVLVDPATCIGCKLCSWACPYGAREYDEIDGVMKKCTLCVDRIYNMHLPKEDRIPACVRACPTGARAFGNLADPESDVSRSVAERGGVKLLSALGYRPVNAYLPVRARNAPEATSREGTARSDRTANRRQPKEGMIERMRAWFGKWLVRWASGAATGGQR